MDEMMKLKIMISSLLIVFPIGNAQAFGSVKSRNSHYQRDTSRAYGILLKMPVPIKRGFLNEESTLRVAESSLKRLGTYPVPVLREVVKKVNVKIRNSYGTFGNDELGLKALALTRYVLRVPKSVSITSSGVNAEPRIYAISTEFNDAGHVTHLDALFPLHDINCSLRPASAVGMLLAVQPFSFDLLNEFDYVRSKYGVRRKPGKVDFGP